MRGVDQRGRTGAATEFQHIRIGAEVALRDIKLATILSTIAEALKRENNEMISNTARVLVIVFGLAIAGGNGAWAQQSVGPETESTSSFDGYRAMAVTAGIVAGGLVATIVTDGLVIPVYAWATGAEAGSMLAGVGMPGMGETVRSMGVWSARMARGARYQMGDTIRVLGAVTGGFLADSWYTDK